MFDYLEKIKKADAKIQFLLPISKTPLNGTIQTLSKSQVEIVFEMPMEDKNGNIKNQSCKIVTHPDNITVFWII